MDIRMFGMEIASQIMFWFAFFDSFLTLCGVKVQHGFLLLLIVTLEIVTGFIRQKSEKLFLFLLVHVALLLTTGCFLLFFAKDLVFTAVGTFCVFFSMLLRSADGLKELEKPNLVYLILLAVLYLVDVCMENPFGRSVSYWSFFAIMILRLLYCNFASLNRFVTDRKSSTKMEVKHLKKMSRSMSLIYTGGLALLLGAVSLIRTDSVSEYLLKLLKRFLIWVLHFVPEGDSTANAAAEEMPTQNLNLGNDLPGNPEPSIFADVLEKILVNTTKIVIVLLIVAMIYAIVVAIYRAFYQKQVTEDVQEFIFKEEKKTQLSKEKSEEKIHVWERDPKKRMRKVYRKNMNGFWGDKKEPPEALTPQEQLRMQERQEEEQIRTLYERARYSDDTVTKEEIKEMQELFKK